MTLFRTVGVIRLAWLEEYVSVILIICDFLKGKPKSLSLK